MNSLTYRPAGAFIDWRLIRSPAHRGRSQEASLRHPDLTPLMQVLLLGSVGIFKAFGWLRLAIGGCVGISWLTVLIATPQLPVSSPFGIEEALLTIGLLLLTNGWLALLVRLNWDNSVLSRCRFRTGFAIVALWWIAVFTAIFATLGWATTTQVHFVIPHGTIV